VVEGLVGMGLKKGCGGDEKWAKIYSKHEYTLHENGKRVRTGMEAGCTAENNGQRRRMNGGGNLAGNARHDYPADCS
jgi:hypothetical protein